MSESQDTTLTFNQTIHGITEFIEVAIHTILYVRQVYPADLFVRRKKYDTPVFQSRHPALNEYISSAVKAVGDELALGNVEKVVVVIKNKEQIAMERFIFAIQNMIQVETFDKDSSVENAMSPRSLGQYFRSFLVRLTMIEAQLGQLELGGQSCLPNNLGSLCGLVPINILIDDSTFAIVIELRDGRSPSITNNEEPPPWVPAEKQHTTSGTSDKAELHMIRAVDTGIVNVSLAVQESEEKLRRAKEGHGVNSAP